MFGNESIGFVLVATLVVVVLMSSRTPPNRSDFVAAQTTWPSLTFWRTRDDGDATVHLHSATTGRFGPTVDTLMLDGGRLYTRRDGMFVATVQPALYVFDTTRIDIGTFARYTDRSGSGDQAPALDLGLRYSPVRILGCIAPDIVVTERWGGLGLSFFPNFTVFDSSLRHVGAGAWYGVDWNRDDRSPGWGVGLSFSIIP